MLQVESELLRTPCAHDHFNIERVRKQIVLELDTLGSECKTTDYRSVIGGPACSGALHRMMTVWDCVIVKWEVITKGDRFTSMIEFVPAARRLKGHAKESKAVDKAWTTKPRGDANRLSSSSSTKLAVHPAVNDVAVLPSMISNAGNGLFAERDYKSKELVTIYDGEYGLSEEDLCKRMPQTHINYTEGLYVDGLRELQVGKGMGSFVNHSNKPNSELVAWRGKVVLKTLQVVTQSEEFTVSYGSESKEDGPYKVAMGLQRFVWESFGVGRPSRQLRDLLQPRGNHDQVCQFRYAVKQVTTRALGEQFARDHELDMVTVSSAGNGCFFRALLVCLDSLPLTSLNVSDGCDGTPSKPNWSKVLLHSDIASLRAGYSAGASTQKCRDALADYLLALSNQEPFSDDALEGTRLPMDQIAPNWDIFSGHEVLQVREHVLRALADGDSRTRRPCEDISEGVTFMRGLNDAGEAARLVSVLATGVELVLVTITSAKPMKVMHRDVGAIKICHPWECPYEVPKPYIIMLCSGSHYWPLVPRVQPTPLPMWMAGAHRLDVTTLQKLHPNELCTKKIQAHVLRGFDQHTRDGYRIIDDKACGRGFCGDSLIRCCLASLSANAPEPSETYLTERNLLNTFLNEEALHLRDDKKLQLLHLGKTLFPCAWTYADQAQWDYNSPGIRDLWMEEIALFVGKYGVAIANMCAPATAGGDARMMRQVWKCTDRELKDCAWMVLCTDGISTSHFTSLAIWENNEHTRPLLTYDEVLFLYRRHMPEGENAGDLESNDVMDAGMAMDSLISSSQQEPDYYIHQNALGELVRSEARFDAYPEFSDTEFKATWVQPDAAPSRKKHKKQK